MSWMGFSLLKQQQHLGFLSQHTFIRRICLQSTLGHCCLFRSTTACVQSIILIWQKIAIPTAGWMSYLNKVVGIFTHLPIVPHICVSKLSKHWSRQWLVACSAQSHYLNQCWLNEIGIKIQNFNLWKCVWKCRYFLLPTEIDVNYKCFIFIQILSCDCAMWWNMDKPKQHQWYFTFAAPMIRA